MRSRLVDSYGLDGFRNARTFHSLAMQIAQPREKLLFDENEGGVSGKKQSQLIQDLIDEELGRTETRLAIYDFFRQEVEELRR